MESNQSNPRNGAFTIQRSRSIERFFISRAMHAETDEELKRKMISRNIPISDINSFFENTPTSSVIVESAMAKSYATVPSSSSSSSKYPRQGYQTTATAGESYPHDIANRDNYCLYNSEEHGDGHSPIDKVNEGAVPTASSLQRDADTAIETQSDKSSNDNVSHPVNRMHAFPSAYNPPVGPLINRYSGENRTNSLRSTPTNFSVANRSSGFRKAVKHNNDSSSNRHHFAINGSKFVQFVAELKKGSSASSRKSGSSINVDSIVSSSSKSSDDKQNSNSFNKVLETKATAAAEQSSLSSSSAAVSNDVVRRHLATIGYRSTEIDLFFLDLNVYESHQRQHEGLEQQSDPASDVDQHPKELAGYLSDSAIDTHMQQRHSPVRSRTSTSYTSYSITNATAATVDANDITLLGQSSTTEIHNSKQSSRRTSPRPARMLMPHANNNTTTSSSSSAATAVAAQYESSARLWLCRQFRFMRVVGMSDSRIREEMSKLDMSEAEMIAIFDDINASDKSNQSSASLFGVNLGMMSGTGKDKDRNYSDRERESSVHSLSSRSIFSLTKPSAATVSSNELVSNRVVNAYDTATAAGVANAATSRGNSESSSPNIRIKKNSSLNQLLMSVLSYASISSKSNSNSKSSSPLRGGGRELQQAPGSTAHHYPTNMHSKSDTNMSSSVASGAAAQDYTGTRRRGSGNASAADDTSREFPSGSPLNSNMNTVVSFKSVGQPFFVSGINSSSGSGRPPASPSRSSSLTAATASLKPLPTIPTSNVPKIDLDNYKYDDIWSIIFDSELGQYWYYNRRGGNSTWEAPTEKIGQKAEHLLNMRNGTSLMPSSHMSSTPPDLRSTNHSHSTSNPNSKSNRVSDNSGDSPEKKSNPSPKSIFESVLRRIPPFSSFSSSSPSKAVVAAEDEDDDDDDDVETQDISVSIPVGQKPLNETGMET